MATLMDVIMGRTGATDYTLGSRGNFQPTGSPFSRDGQLGNMGMRNMLRAQQGLAATGIPAPPPGPSPAGIGTGPVPGDQAVYDMAGNVISYQTTPSPFGQLSRAPFAAPSAPPVAAPMPASVVPAPARPPSLMGAPMPMTASPISGPSEAMPPLPPPRPYGLGTPEAPSVRESFMQRLLGGPAYQSNAMPVVMSPQGPMASGQPMAQQVNWGNPESAADFFRADQMARQLGLLG